MDPKTPIDRAYAEMQAAPDDDAKRLRFFERVADSELFLLLSKEPEGNDILPEVFAPEGGEVVLAFDTEDRLVDFTGKPSPYVALSGRSLVQMLCKKELGLGLNLGISSSDILLTNEALNWLASILDQSPDEIKAKPVAFNAPKNIPEILLAALDAKLVSVVGMVEQVWLTGVTYDDGQMGHILGFVGAKEEAEKALAKAAHEALTFSGLEAGTLDVGFFDPNEPTVAAIARHGISFELPQKPKQGLNLPKAPGSDPNFPPKLK
ncbi:MAG: SseB family protein [Rhodobacteraceae bacterium]|nr:MAG: SseB family protein [Paracoccaceae bacterium]